MATFTGSPDAHVETTTVDGHTEFEPASDVTFEIVTPV